MDLTPAEIDDLLAPWAFGTLDAHEREVVERALASDVALARRAVALRRAVVALDAMDATVPPAQLRDAVLARATPRPAETGADALTVFATQVAALDELIEGLTEDEWLRPVGAYDWNVHGLVAHLMVVERYTSARLGLGGTEPDGSHHHLALGVAEIEHELRGAPRSTGRAWSHAAHGTIEAMGRGEGPASDDAVDFHGWPFTTDGLLVARGFEVWTHADDIRRATGRPLVAPAAAELRTMSRLSVTSLPLMLPLVAPGRPFEGARIVLTGDGGATFDLGDPARRSTLVVADVVDYCRYAARRIPYEELVHEIDGDGQLGRELLHAAQSFAV